jgi:nicotinate-nucleotide pyrophosphorylase
MRYFAHIEVEIEAETLEQAQEAAQQAADDVKDNNIFEVIDSFVVNVE